jgi:hypothetical protein
MICVECLERIVELTRLERISHEARERYRNKAKIPTTHYERNLLGIAERDARLDELICRLELKRHQRHHIAGKPPASETRPASNAAVA